MMCLNVLGQVQEFPPTTAAEADARFQADQVEVGRDFESGRDAAWRRHQQRMSDRSLWGYPKDSRQWRDAERMSLEKYGKDLDNLKYIQEQDLKDLEAKRQKEKADIKARAVSELPPVATPGRSVPPQKYPQFAKSMEPLVTTPSWVLRKASLLPPVATPGGRPPAATTRPSVATPPNYAPQPPSEREPGRSEVLEFPQIPEYPSTATRTTRGAEACGPLEVWIEKVGCVNVMSLAPTPTLPGVPSVPPPATPTAPVVPPELPSVATQAVVMAGRFPVVNLKGAGVYDDGSMPYRRGRAIYPFDPATFGGPQIPILGK